jgi:hypothetical protein
LQIIHRTFESHRAGLKRKFEVGFQDALGGGAIFYIDLPVRVDTVAIDMVAEGTAQRILLCEREPAIKNAVRMKLSPAGFMHSALSKMTFPLEFLKPAVRDRLGLSPSLREKEVA